jgi:hypothetical protein
VDAQSCAFTTHEKRESLRETVDAAFKLRQASRLRKNLPCIGISLNRDDHLYRRAMAGLDDCRSDTEQKLAG